MTFPSLVFPLLSVYKVFESVAKKYDVMNDAMSLGIHRLWKDSLLHVMNPQPGLRLLDTAGGTGTSQFYLGSSHRSMHNKTRFALSFLKIQICIVLQVTSLSASWNTHGRCMNVNSVRRHGPVRRHRGRTSLITMQQTGRVFRSLGRWCVTSTKKCLKLVNRGQRKQGSAQVQSSLSQNTHCFF